MPRITEISDKFFNRDDAGMTLAEFTSQLMTDESKNGNVGVKVTSVQDYMVNGQNVYQFLSDRGAGRIYDGLKSLEMMSRVIRGVSVSSVTLFDNKIIAFTADDMRNAPMDIAMRITNANIGVVDIHAYARAIKSPEIAAYDTFISNIAREVRAGSFKTEPHIGEALIRVKALIKSVMFAQVSR